MGGSKRPRAAVYRGEVACEGCAESVAHLLINSPSNYRVHYLGPREKKGDIRADTLTLDKVDLFAWPGGGDDEDQDYLKVQQYTKTIQHFVKMGGKYAGFCMGAFLAQGPGANRTFFGLLPEGSYVSGERFQPGAQVNDTNDTVILTDWTFHTGNKKGTTEKKRWQYFQDGGLIHVGPEVSPVTLILGHYTYTNDICAAIVPYGKGHVGLVGVHPEADKSWYKGNSPAFQNPDGVKTDIGHDFVETLTRASETEKEGAD